MSQIQANHGMQGLLDDALQRAAQITAEDWERMKADSWNAQKGENTKTINGEPSLFFSVYDCPKCKNKMLIAYVEDSVCKYRDCECRRIRKAKCSAIKSGLGDLLDKRVKDFKTTESWQKELKDSAVNFIRNKGNWFAVLGQSGSGKTHICAAICNHLLNEGKSVYYLNWLVEGRKLAGARFDNGEYDSLMRRFEEANVLYVDDLFKTREQEFPTATEVKIARELMSYRMNYPDKITLISSEFTIEEMMQFDGSLAGRIREKTAPKGYLIQIKKCEENNYRWKL